MYFRNSFNHSRDPDRVRPRSSPRHKVTRMCGSWVHRCFEGLLLLGWSNPSDAVDVSEMPDPLYLSLWFSSFEADDMLPHALAVMRQFSFSAQQPGITYLAVHPVSWNEPTILERRFRPGVTPEEAVL